MILRRTACCVLAVVAFFVPGDLAGQTLPPDTNVASYEIDVTLDPETHRLMGGEKIRWVNRADQATDEIFLHLYLNAFANSRTTFMRELAWWDASNRTDPGDDWGWIRVGRLTFDDGSDLLPGMEFVRPDDGNSNDFTIARVHLPRVVDPGAVIELEIEFEAQLPRIVSRTGFFGDFHFVAQWFPKIAVFRGERGWNAHQFHALSEFFADFGTYRVTMTIPEDWVLGATGIEVGSSEPANGRRAVTYRAERVHDFAWCTAPPDLMVIVEAEFEPGRHVPVSWFERARTQLDMSAADLELPPMRLRLMVPREQSMLAPRMVRAARLAAAWFGLFYGAYPYPQLTIVSPPDGAEGADGMEYPTLIATGADGLDGYDPFSRFPALEALTVHEFGHQYFQGLLASNEFEEAWLDEGLTSYADTSCMVAATSDGLLSGIADFDYWADERLSLSLRRAPVTTGRKSWGYPRWSDYYLATYTKMALVLRTLEGLIGPESMARGMRDYVDRYRFRHPTEADLVEVLSEAAGQDLSPFFDQAIFGAEEPDWAVVSVHHRRPPPAGGFIWDGESWNAVGDDRDTEDAVADDSWLVELELARRSDFVGPVEVEMLWSDGRVERRTWDSQTRRTRWRLEGRGRLEQVVIDPDVVWALETSRADNYWRERAASTKHPLWWVRDALRLARHWLLRSE
ncbi:MAG: M1 family metallopeptidase [Acidobacteria bacterium]|nr:M1 family metallopeptidase [Acidobacteriota bacterium]